MKKINNLNPSPTLPFRPEADQPVAETNGGLKNGFTLVELLIVVIIIGILTMVSASSYRTAQIKARDTERKASLDAVSKSLMMYYNDTGAFPSLTSNQLFGNSAVGFTGANGIIYMRKTPLDPTHKGVYTFVYKTDGKIFNLFANLENVEDSQLNSGYYPGGVGIGVSYRYGVASPNSVLKNW